MPFSLYRRNLGKASLIVKKMVMKKVVQKLMMKMNLKMAFLYLTVISQKMRWKIRSHVTCLMVLSYFSHSIACCFIEGKLSGYVCVWPLPLVKALVWYESRIWSQKLVYNCKRSNQLKLISTQIHLQIKLGSIENFWFLSLDTSCP